MDKSGKPEPSLNAFTTALPQSSGRELVLPGIEVSVLEGPDRGASAQAKQGTITIGSAAENQLALSDPSVSRRHLELRLRPDGVQLIDFESTNGTFVDGVRVLKAWLAPSSLVRLGETVLRVTPVDEPISVDLHPTPSFGRMLGQSTAMREVFGILARVAPTDTSVLVEGETGTGKELVAEALHTEGARAQGPLVSIDCGAISPNLIESELFGHLRGAFTGAIQNRRGVFEEAHGGTLFLDEIGELPIDLQPKLLRALEKREIRRVGSTQTIPVDVRIVAATNRDLEAEVNRGTFREDLYFRLAVVRVRLPALRHRPEDIPLLVKHFVKQLSKTGGSVSQKLLNALSQKAWPGNVRELRNAVERALALSRPPGTRPPETASTGTPTTSHSHASWSRIETLWYSALNMPIKDGLEYMRDAFERNYIEEALKSQGSVSAAARKAGVNRRYLQRAMQRIGMYDEDNESGEP